MATKEFYAYIAYRLWEGDDTLDELFKALVEDGFTDELGFWVYPEEED